MGHFDIELIGIKLSDESKLKLAEQLLDYMGIEECDFPEVLDDVCNYVEEEERKKLGLHFLGEMHEDPDVVYSIFNKLLGKTGIFHYDVCSESISDSEYKFVKEYNPSTCTMRWSLTDYCYGSDSIFDDVSPFDYFKEKLENIAQSVGIQPSWTSSSKCFAGTPHFNSSNFSQSDILLPDKSNIEFYQLCKKYVNMPLCDKITSFHLDSCGCAEGLFPIELCDVYEELTSIREFAVEDEYDELVSLIDEVLAGHSHEKEGHMFNFNPMGKIGYYFTFRETNGKKLLVAEGKFDEPLPTKEEIKQQKRAQKDEEKQAKAAEKAKVLAEARKAKALGIEQEKNKLDADLKQLGEYCVANNCQFADVEKAKEALCNYGWDPTLLDKLFRKHYGQRVQHILKSNNILVSDVKEKHRILFDKQFQILKNKYINKDNEKSLKELKANNPDIDWEQMVAFVKELFNVTLSEYLIQNDLLNSNINQVSFEGVKYKPGEEPPSIKARVDKLFANLATAYPDRVITKLGSHRHWDETATELYKLLGYQNRKSFFAAYGYETNSAAGGNKSKDVSVVIDEIKRRYPNGGTYDTIEEFIKANDDLAKRLNTIKKDAPKLFGMTFKNYLITLGFVFNKK